MILIAAPKSNFDLTSTIWARNFVFQSEEAFADKVDIAFAAIETFRMPMSIFKGYELAPTNSCDSFTTLATFLCE
jgi:hypothetical protein